MTDPRDFDRTTQTSRRLDLDSREHTPTPWGWIASAVLIVVVLLLVLTSGNYERTASNNAGPPATGMAPRTTIPAPGPIIPPAEIPATTGQGR